MMEDTIDELKGQPRDEGYGKGEGYGHGEGGREGCRDPAAAHGRRPKPGAHHATSTEKVPEARSSTARTRVRVESSSMKGSAAAPCE